MKKYLLLLVLSFIALISIAQNYWSNSATWPGNIKPTAGEAVTIPMGTTIILDENTPELGGLTILGTLQFAHQNISLSASWIMLHGTLQVGSPQNLFTHKATITLTGSDVNESVMGMGTRGIMVMGGSLELHAASPNILYTKLNQHAAANTTSINVVNNTNWQVTDEIAIAPTDYYLAGNGTSVTQRVSISSINTNTINISQPLNAFRWGLLQYVTPNGLSLDSNNRVNPPKPNTDSTTTPTVLDERAVVANLTRNIVIQAPNDALWQNQGFGVHVMVMGTGAQAHLNGVEIKRGGQRNRLGRYPFHWHMLSYSGSATLADATGQYIRNSVINSSTNRGIVIHGTNGVLVKGNVVYDILGHGIFTEDAVERRNLIDSNVVLRIRNTTPTALPILKVHEGNSNSDFGSSGFWISNPDNTLTNNIAADCGAFGFWLAFTTQPWGESINVLHTDGLLLNPSRLRFGIFDNNTASSCRNRGIMLDLVENSNTGTVIDFQYWSTTNGRQPIWPNSTLRRFSLSRYKVWKNGQSGIWDRAVWPDNFEVVSADNCGRFFAGSGADGIIERSLVVGTSLNHLMNGTDRPLLDDALGGNQTPAAFATYHSAFDIKDNIIINFPAVANTRSGAFATEDYYLRPVDKGPIRNVNNLLIQSHIGVKLPALFPHYALAGALWDPLGNWNNGIIDSNKYFVYNNPFFTYGQTPVNVQGGTGAGGVLVNGHFYGINDFEINRANDPQQDLMAIKVNRLNSRFDSVATWQITQAGDVSWLLAHMRHFAAQKNGYYDLSFPTIDNVTDVAFTVENMLTANDSLIMAIEYSGSYSINQVYISSWPNFMANGHANWPTSYTNSPSAGSKYVFQPVQNRTALVNAGGVGAYWHDRANNKVWVKIKGGIPMFWNDNDYGQFSDEKLYRRFGFRIFGEQATIWNGNINNDWGNAANWSNGIPSATTNTIIPLVANQPIISSNQQVQNLTVDSGVVISSVSNLTINGSLNNYGTINGTVLFTNPNYSQVVHGNGTIQNLTVQNTNGITLYPSKDAWLNMTGRLSLQSNTSFNTNNNFVLKSSANSTAQITSLPTNAIISGAVTVERYLQNKRAWRLITAPLSSNGLTPVYLNNSWQQQTHIVGVAGDVGMDAVRPAHSFMTYNTNNWMGINNTITTELFTNATTASNKAFAAFITGNRTIDINNTAESSSVTLQATGRLLQGTQNFNLSNLQANEYALIGNPYASPVDLNQVFLNAGTANINRTFYTWDPTLSTTGGYATISWNGTDYDIIPLNTQQTQHIQSGQAFFVQATANSATNITFEENDKTISILNNVFGAGNGQIDKLKINLQKLQNGTPLTIDGVLTSFGPNFSKQILPTEDADKLFNNEEGITIRRNNKSLSIERRPYITNINDTLFLALNRLQNNTNYTLNINPQNFDAGMQAYLVDKLLSTETPINLQSSSQDIIITSVQTNAADRWMIVFRGTGNLPNNALSLVATKKERDVQLTWNIANEQGVKEYELQRSADGTNFQAINAQNAQGKAEYKNVDTKAYNGINYYRVKMTMLNDDVRYSNVVTINLKLSTVNPVTVYPNPIKGSTVQLQLNELEAGNYTIKVIDMQGKLLQTQNIQHQGGTTSRSLGLGNLAAGDYQLLLEGKNITKTVSLIFL